MKIKLDENIGRRGVELLTSAGHDVMTVRDQQLQGASDESLFSVCGGEGRILITLDHDFGQVLRFPRETNSGEPGPRLAPQAVLTPLQQFLVLAEIRSPVGALWIVEPGRIRVHLDRDG